jgi:hypothetical protein
MKRVGPWIFGSIIVLALIILVVYGRSSRQAYRIAQGAVEQRAELTQDYINAVTDMAVASVDLALKLAGDLP